MIRKSILQERKAVIAIYPSLISADILNLERVIRDLEPFCAGFHIDIMDGHFVPNLTMGPLFANALAKITKKPLWVHIMAENPESMIETLHLTSGSIISIHIESKKNINNLISQIKEKKYLPSIALSPKTEAESIFPILSSVHQVLIMSVEPGASGQPFLAGVMRKIEPLIAYRDKNKLNFTIAMDGGINEKNIGMLAEAGVQEFAIASGIFDDPNPLEKLRTLSHIK